MGKQARILSTFVAVALAGVVLVACSGTSDQGDASTASTAAGASSVSASAQEPRNPAQKAEVSTPAATMSVQDQGGMKVVGSQPDKQYLHDLMQRSDFALAFASMDGANELPSWVGKGGTATPAEMVDVDGESRLMAEACKPHDCPAERIVLLYDKDNRGMQGVFVRDPAPGTDAGASDQASYTWLGKPDDGTRAWLKNHLTSR